MHAQAPTPPALIRRATPADAVALRALTQRTFADTFGHLYPPNDLAEFFATVYALDAFQDLLRDPAQAAWFLELDGTPIGHALAGPCTLPHPEVRPGDGELKRLYLVKDAHNGGHGTRLLRTALDWLLRDGPRTLWLGVWSENVGAQRFYARHGFEHVGEYIFEVGKCRDREFILRRPATTARD